MSKTNIPPSTITRLWTQAGGRCQFSGCNDYLLVDNLTTIQMNRAHVAHIVADSVGGPRGDKKLSPKLAKDISNLMLMCVTHHDLIDKPATAWRYSKELLTQWKQEHETRIERLTAMQGNPKTQIVVFKAPIGQQIVEIDSTDVARAVLPRYPEQKPIEISFNQYALGESHPDFFKTEQANLKLRVERELRWSNNKPHLSIFALAPIPHLVAFGRYLGDKSNATVYQKHGNTWEWPASRAKPLGFKFSAPKKIAKTSTEAALVLSVSADIPESHTTTGAGIPIFHFRSSVQARDAVKTDADIQTFGKKIYEAIDKIRKQLPTIKRLHIFPAIPVSLAVHLGLVLPPKAHPTITIHDRVGNTFREAIDIEPY